MNLLKNQVFWYTLKQPNINKTCKPTETEFVIIGGGIAGLSAALRLKNLGIKNIVIIEKDFCGAGASGKSSGFVSPDSELQLNNFITRFGNQKANNLWEFSANGVNLIKENIEKYSINCDYQIQDTLFIANSKHAVKIIDKEHNAREKFGYKNTLYSHDALSTILGSQKYYNAIRSYDTFGISAYLYCLALKEVLLNLGVQIYENTKALSICKSGVNTEIGFIKADQIIVCTDRFIQAFDILTSKIYQAQTFLLVSKPLTDKTINKIFPDSPLMVSDSDLVFNYYRIIKDNRLLIGGGSMIDTYSPYMHCNATRLYYKISHYFKNKFPNINIDFEYLWPGMLGVSKDLVPIACQDELLDNVHYISAATGLSWATSLGNYIAEKIINKRSDFDYYFTPKRKFPTPDILNKIIGKPAAFGLSNLITILK